jgi:hypothetical protein
MHLASLARRVARADLYRHWYAVIIIAPAKYRAALWEASGEADGERYFRSAIQSPKVQNEVLNAIQFARSTPVGELDHGIVNSIEGFSNP